jgi:hypothetical protein
MTIKCKLICQSISDVDRDTRRATFLIQPSPELTSDESFAKPPSGELAATISNPRALKELAVGGLFWLYLTEAQA